MIVDKFHRVHDYLRISLTDNCNLRCFYCMPEEEYAFTPPSRLMQPDEILGLARVFTDMGVRKIRLTGGEPLVRKDAAEIIEALATLPVQLTMTTNGTRLHHFTDVLDRAGVRALNVSLDTLREDRFRLITRRDQFSTVMGNIRLLLDRGIQVKVNAVIMKDLNDAELNDFVAWTRDTPVHVRFIEFMPFSGNHWSSNQVVPWTDMLDAIQTRYPVERLQDEPHDTSKRYKVPGNAGTFAFISTMSAPFCETCNRIRLTADGKMKNCLFSEEEMDLLSAWRNGGDVRALIQASILQKAERLGGQMPDSFRQLEADTLHNRSMITIGG
ncbi:GTP 3',8-cyclase MoaA [Dinghuibacter silviterrae]|uniref:GTP 3',8-cyclase n=1 Tax=Dinghuibacter silviterrae TaxID=1539049 RepID=A0A4R8DUU7_9BACT|nr:GTP 3',8-cyclase MoaA [Dinghuibacter silviterrae]TDX01235.1 cyclic pyranopterin phosphate synthase [Dinghuibacter silviterrae]